MYAIFEDGSRQYRVEKDSIVVIDYREVERGHLLELPKVLLLQNGADTLIGQPYVDGARVFGEVIDERVKVKTMTQKFRRRKASKRLKGHTQPHIRLKIQHILKAGEAVPTPPRQPTATEPAASTPAEPASTPPA